LKPSTSVQRVAAATGITGAAAARLAAEGRLFRFGELDVVLGLSRDPILGTSDLVVSYAPAEIRGGSRAGLDAIAEQAADLFGGFERIVMRVPQPASTPTWARPYMHYVERLRGNESPASASAPEGLVVKRVEREEEERFVLGLLVEAIGAGYRAAGFAADSLHVGTFAEAWLASPDHGLSAVVATREGQLVGCGTWTTWVDDLTGEAYLELVDVTVLEAARGSTNAIVRAIDDAAPASPRILRGHVVAEADHDAMAILRRLRSEGWQRIYDLWLVPP
jgi:hypothetical protein